MFYDKKGFYYVADTGNNRVLKLDKNFNVLAEIDEADGMSLSTPTGVSADTYGDVYIADSGNGRIIHLECGFMEEISRHIVAHHGFELQCDSSVLYGVCKDCKGA